ncbi:hypothetical protein Ddc_11876 [Ditylenchus destructor]|nr:hypothetical protein Ddc_11876 [Ditylenchus destructor]
MEWPPPRQGTSHICPEDFSLMAGLWRRETPFSIVSAFSNGQCRKIPLAAKMEREKNRVEVRPSEKKIFVSAERNNGSRVETRKQRLIFSLPELSKGNMAFRGIEAMSVEKCWDVLPNMGNYERNV